MYTYMQLPSFLGVSLCTHLDAQASEYANGSANTHTRTSAVPPRTTATPHRSAAGPEAVHTHCNVVTRTVFHAPMFALNADAASNACEPNHTRSTPTETARTFRRGYVCAQTHADACARAHTRSCVFARARISGAAAHNCRAVSKAPLRCAPLI